MTNADPMRVQAMLQEGVSHHQAGRLAEAQGKYREVLAVAPRHPEAWHLLGLLALQQGDVGQAVDCIRQAIHADSSRGHYFFSLGNALLSRGNMDEVAACYRQAIQLKPDHAEAHCNLANVLLTQGRLDEALECCRRALAIRPDYPEACNNLGTVLKELGRGDESVASYRRALQLRPDYVDAFNNLGGILLAQQRLEEAEDAFRHALALRPADGTLHYNLGNVLRDQGRPDEAVDSYRQAIRLKPGVTEMYRNLGVTLQNEGALEDAADCFRQAMRIDPEDTDSVSNLIFALDLTAGVSATALYEERRRWGEAYSARLVPSGPIVFGNAPDPERRLKIGYVSADFRRHSAAIGFGSMLLEYDRDRFDVHAYSNTLHEDMKTELFRRNVTCWHKIVDLDDEAVADQIRRDGIDILVDLSGHSAGNRLRVFARKPAPIQVTAWGYAGGTGLTAMDVLLTDSVIVPPEEKQYYAETVRYLPSVIGAWFPDTFPPVDACGTAEAGGGITFGSFNRLCKISTETCLAWARILKALPHSRMLLKTGELGNAGTQARLQDRLERHGIPRERVDMLGSTPWVEHVATFNRIDISLDPYPQCGGVTTLEGLMMGVPVVTLCGKTFVGRGSSSILTTLELEGWIAHDEAGYVDIAVRKAQDLPALVELKRQLRPRFEASILGDTKAYVRVAEDEYRKLWREWCLKQGKA